MLGVYVRPYVRTSPAPDCIFTPLHFHGACFVTREITCGPCTVEQSERYLGVSLGGSGREVVEGASTVQDRKGSAAESRKRAGVNYPKALHVACFCSLPLPPFPL